MEGAVGIVAFLVVLAALAPIFLAVGSGRTLPAFLAVLLTLCAVIMMTVAKGFGDATFVVGAWIGALICGLAASPSPRAGKRLYKATLDITKALLY